MALIVLVAVATAVGFLVILLSGRGQRVSPAAALPAGADAAGVAWVRRHGLDGLQQLLLSLFSEMGFRPEGAERGADTIAFQAVDATPIRGGRIYVHAILDADGAQVGGDEVRALADAARAEAAGKAVLVTLGRFTAEAREAARDVPVELLDGEALAALVRRYLPQAWATRTI
jgi:hypothetical protein